MKKVITLLLITNAFQMSAQTTINNGGFENWDNVGAANEEPTGWNSNKSGGGLASSGPQTCFRSNDAHTGTYSAKIQTIYFILAVVNGNITTGKIQAPSINKAEGFIEASDVNRMPFTGRPDSLVGWYKYTQATSGTNANQEQGQIKAWLHSGSFYDPKVPVNNNHPDSSMNEVGTAVFTTAAANQATWTRFSVPFSYTNGNTPTYIMINATSSANQNTVAPGSTGDGSILWLDDIEVVYNTSSVATVAKEMVTVYTQGQNLIVDLQSKSYKNIQVKVYDFSGKLVKQQALQSQQINNVEIPAAGGLYIYHLQSEGKTIQNGKLNIR